METNLKNGRVYKYINANADFVTIDFNTNKFRVFDKEKLVKIGNFYECMKVVNELICKYNLEIC